MVTVVLLGGVNIFGGRGSLVGVILALFVIGGLRNALGLIDVSGRRTKHRCRSITGVLGPGTEYRPTYPIRHIPQAAGRGKCKASIKEGTVKKLFQTLGPAFLVFVLLVLAGCGGSSSTGSGTTTSGGGNKLNIVFLPKAINNPYFDTAANGGKQAAGDLNGSFNQVGPSTASAADQVTFINNLTAQHVSAIVVSADDPTALAPALKQAMAQGIKVVSYDSDVERGRPYYLL